MHFDGGDVVADFLHARESREISFHQSATAALFNLAFGLRGTIASGANIVVTDLDHMANVSPWESLWGEGRGLEVRRARITGEGTLDHGHLLSLVDDRTALLAVTSASNGTGSLVPVTELAAAVRERSPRCLVAVDAVHHAPHRNNARDVMASLCLYCHWRVRHSIQFSDGSNFSNAAARLDCTHSCMRPSMR